MLMQAKHTGRRALATANQRVSYPTLTDPLLVGVGF